MGVHLYSANTAHLAFVTGVISADLASDQSCDFHTFFPKVAKAVLYMVSYKFSLLLVADVGRLLS